MLKLCIETLLNNMDKMMVKRTPFKGWSILQEEKSIEEVVTIGEFEGGDVQIYTVNKKKEIVDKIKVGIDGELNVEVYSAVYDMFVPEYFIEDDKKRDVFFPEPIKKEKNDPEEVGDNIGKSSTDELENAS